MDLDYMHLIAFTPPGNDPPFPTQAVKYNIATNPVTG